MDTKATSKSSMLISYEMKAEINSLPEELLLYIFSLLEIGYQESPITIKRMLLVCKKWTRIFYHFKAPFQQTRHGALVPIRSLFVRYKPQLWHKVDIIRRRAFFADSCIEDRAFGSFFDSYKTFELKDFSLTAAYLVGILYVTHKISGKTITIQEDDLCDSCIKHIERIGDNTIGVFFNNFFYGAYSLQQKDGEISFNNICETNIWSFMEHQTWWESPIRHTQLLSTSFNCSFDKCMISILTPRFNELWWIDVSTKSILARFTFELQDEDVLSSIHKDLVVISGESISQVDIYQFDSRSHFIEKRCIDLEKIKIKSDEVFQVFEDIKILSEDFLLAAVSDEDDSVTICVFVLNTEEIIKLTYFNGDYVVPQHRNSNYLSNFSLYNNNLIYTTVDILDSGNQIIHIQNLITRRKFEFSSRELYPKQENAKIDSYVITQSEVPTIIVRIKYWDNISNELILDLVELSIDESPISKIASVEE